MSLKDVGFSVEFLDASSTNRPMLPYQRYEAHQVICFLLICVHQAWKSCVLICSCQLIFLDPTLVSNVYLPMEEEF
jgi:hypothetical protein